MPERLTDFPWALAILSIIVGMIGGCGSASFQVLSGRELSIAIFLAYTMLGAAIGAAAFLVITIALPDLAIANTLLMSGAMGAGSTVSVAMVRIIAKIALRWKGFEAEVTFRRCDRDDP